MLRQESKPTTQKPEEIRKMFDAIAPTYDSLNHLLSFGLDIRWRKKTVQLLEEKRGGTILDIAAGSGDLSLEALNVQPKLVVATDFSQNMLDVFQQKLKGQNHSSRIELVSCDALALPFQNESFDATVVAFGIRNFSDRLASLKEMLRVLRPGGISLILELSKPKTPIISQLYVVYTQIGLPLIGRVISQHNSAYRYLPESISKFPEQSEFLSMMNAAGFLQASAVPLTFGVATIYVGRK
jgi:demethylmenaquinone methyltransferase/2-methoxy-6-polyprenyl-1,4-benzoquinol methylase